MSIRARQFMFVQDIDKLGFKLDDLNNILDKIAPDEWAWIIHDKDQSKNGGLVKPHIHLVLKFKNPRTLNKVAEELKSKPEYLEIWSGRINNAYSYLIHLTTNSQKKHVYSPKDVKASFDFIKKINDIRKSISNTVVNDALTLYSNGAITRNQLRNKIGNLQFAKHLDVIKKINKVLDEQMHVEWLKEFNGQRMICKWYYGAAGVGKTRMAIKEAKESGKAYCILGSSNDYFQDYRPEDHIVILDELRPDDFKYSDLLKIMDPYQHDKHAPRRYHNSALNISELIVTTPYSPKEFYDKSKINDKKIDTYEQLKRRISKIVKVTPGMVRKDLGE